MLKYPVAEKIKEPVWLLAFGKLWHSVLNRRGLSSAQKVGGDHSQRSGCLGKAKPSPQKHNVVPFTLTTKKNIKTYTVDQFTPKNNFINIICNRNDFSCFNLPEIIIKEKEIKDSFFN